MMTRQESKRGSKAKALCFLPVLAAGLLLFGQKEYVYARVSPLPESGDVRTETVTALQEAVSSARALASDTSLEGKIQQVQSISASIADALSKMSLEVSEEVEAGIQEVLDALDSHMEFEINGKTVGLSELVKGVQDGLYDEEQLEKAITAFRIKDEDDSSRLEVSFDGQVMVLDENGGNTLTLTTISKPDSGVSLTTSSSSMSVVRGDGEDDVRIYVDGKEVSREDFKKMSPDQFASIVVNKGDGTKYLSVTTVGKPDSAVSMTASSSSVSVAYGDGDDDVRVYVDGKEVSKADLKEMSPEEISAVTVAKPEEGGKTIYMVTKRQEQKAKAGNEPRYFIDGEEVASEAVNGLDPAWITSMRVEKDDETGESLIHIALRPAGRKAMKAAKAGEGK